LWLWGDGLTATYDLATSIGKVRLNIPDTNTADAEFTDEELQAFLDQNQANIFFAAADACDVLATNQVYILKVMTDGDVSLNGAAVSAELRARAATLRERGKSGTGSATAETGLAIVHSHSRRY
jgi:hypothetical protein